jgi:hypothetical protein
MNPEARKLVERLKPEVSRVILALDDYLASKANLDAPLEDCSRPIIEGKQFLEATQKYIEAMRTMTKDGHLKSKINYITREAKETVMQSIPNHYPRLSKEFPEILNGHKT